MRPRLRHALILAVATAILLGTAWFFRVPILIGFAQAWSVNDTLEPADAILVLGGGLETRPFAAARLYHDGYAPTIVIYNVQPSPTEELGLTESSAQRTMEVLLAQSVPRDAIVTIGTNVSSTFDEAIATRDWIETEAVRNLILPTEFPSTRRVRWIFNKTLRDTDARLMIESTDSWDYAITNWWQKEQGLIALQNELIKYLYYRLKY